jgi:hypothetical protein
MIICVSPPALPDLRPARCWPVLLSRPTHPRILSSRAAARGCRAAPFYGKHPAALGLQALRDSVCLALLLIGALLKDAQQGAPRQA